MIFLRKANERGHANHGWLDSWHTFSFADYYDPNFMGFSALRVINDDVIDAGQGFGTHPHKDMEILTYVLEGAVEHQDSMGNKEQVPAGEFQIMSAGTGIRHSEYNPSATDKLHLDARDALDLEHGGLAARRGAQCGAPLRAPMASSKTTTHRRLDAVRDGRAWAARDEVDVLAQAGIRQVRPREGRATEEDQPVRAWIPRQCREDVGDEMVSTDLLEVDAELLGDLGGYDFAR